MSFLKKNIANAITGTGILLWIIACIVTATEPSWFWSEAILIWALITDALDGKAARKFGSTKVGPYLDDIADFINFGLHPASGSGLSLAVSVSHHSISVRFSIVLHDSRSKNKTREIISSDSLLQHQQ
jgi:phosphatidylglycerophosphate synthase